MPKQTASLQIQNLERTVLDLRMAYDSTIEAWTRALDYRDKEPEGHTRRVAEMTVRLARKAGVKEEDLPHFHRGALLHDIGKLSIPDGVLHKTGGLTKSEWILIRGHPQFAYDLLSPIVFLFPALDIPHYHHEKWDGSGYPDGLRGERIPYSARIFAVVDVYNALTSVTVYREAWTPEKAREYIKDQAGKHFDPVVADLFLSSWKTIHLE